MPGLLVGHTLGQNRWAGFVLVLTRLIYSAFKLNTHMNSVIKITLKSALLIIPGILLFVLLATNFTREQSPVAVESTISTSLDEESSPFSDILEPVEAVPVRIYSETVGIDAEIIEVGVSADGALEAPIDFTKAGWYKKSAFPGHKGNMIIDGHYDTNTGAPAAFWNLKNLKVDDKVLVVNEYGVEHAYVVEELIHVSINDIDRLDKLNKYSGRTLTLITCGGFWNPVVGTYDERLIVKAILEEAQKAKDSL